MSRTNTADIVAGQRDLDLIWSWNSVVPSARDECIHDVIAARAREQPEDPAIEAADGRLTYEELDILSTRLAKHIAPSLEPDAIVPLCFEKSVFTAVTAVAVLKAGAAFCLLDTSQPVKRLESIVEQTTARLLCASPGQRALGEYLAGRSARLVVVGHDNEALDSRSEIAAFDHYVNPNSTCYVVFTSGSTGTPKGIAISHTSISTALHLQSLHLGFRSGERVFDWASHSFDVAVHNMLATLAAGACLCVPDEAGRLQDPATELTRLRATIANLTPSIARLIDPEEVPTLHTLIFLGEALHRHDVERWPERVRKVPTYGPAECTPISTMNLSISPSIASGSTSAVEIGIGVGVNTWVADAGDSNILLPIGSVGELLLEGPLLAQGYISNSPQTMAAFIASPTWLSSRSQSRLYKTGDLVRYQSNGSLLFVGRKDTQVKIHGARVELADIEATLQSYLGHSSRAVAETIERQEGGLLAAILQDLRHPSSLQRFEPESTLLASLHRQLPSYMVPAAFFTIDRLPYTASGKLDRRSLREALFATEIYHTPSKVQSRTLSAMECKMRVLWAEVLGINKESVGPDHDFFATGGDSLKLIKLVGAARAAGLALDIVNAMKRPSLEGMAMSTTNAMRPAEVVPFCLLPRRDIVAELASSCGVHISQIEDAYPCTPLQEGLVSLGARSPGEYWLRIQLDASHLDIAAFKSAWRSIYDATSTLRTRIVAASCGTMQVVLLEDLTWLDGQRPPDQRSALRLNDPLSYFLMETIAGKCMFTMHLHHAISDAWSLDLLMANAWRVYESRTAEPRVSYFSPFVRWTQSIRDNAEWQTYWSEAFAGIEAAPFPVYRKNPRTQPNIQIARKQCSTAPRLQGVTPATVVRAALALVIAQYTRSKDVVFGTTLSGRNASLPDIEQVVGPTITTVPLRTRMSSPSMTVREWLELLYEQSIEMIPYEHTGLQNVARLGDEAARACDFQTLLVVQPHADVGGNHGFAKAEMLAETLTTYPLTLECFINRDSVEFRARHDQSVLSDWQMERLLQQVSLAMAQLADDSLQNRPIRNLDLVSEDEKVQIWTRNASVPPSISKSLVQLFHEQVEQQSAGHLAVVGWDHTFTYRQLNSLSDRLALHLKNIGVRNGMLVPVCFSKTSWVVCAMIGLLKAGAAFVPIDPSMPRARRQTVIEDTDASFVLVSNDNAVLFDDCALKVLTTDTDLMQTLPGRECLSCADPADIAYVMFTSGSTGRPKGVVMQHSAVSSSCIHHGNTLGFGAFTRHLQFSSYSFDLTRVINDFDINAMFLSTAVTRVIDPKKVPSIRTIAFGGEINTQLDYKRWQLPGRKVFGVYGPTECCVYCAVLDASESTQDGLIGRPMSSVGWIVDPQDHTRLAPSGSVGELAVESPTLAASYLGNPEKTAASFPESPPWLGNGCAGVPGRQGRVYLTGDLVQYTSDGSGMLKYLGRKDKQIKINGQRMELPEVEHHVRGAISEAKAVFAEVLPASDGLPSDMLVAFVVFKDTAARSGPAHSPGEAENAFEIFNIPAQAERYISESLPAHMVPRMYITMHDLPYMMTSPKVDRSRLRHIGVMQAKQQLASLQHDGARKAQPESDIERVLQKLWAAVLKMNDLQHIGRHDSFFSLGADSISAMKLAEAARRSRFILTVAEIFKSPTLSEQALLLHRLPQDHAGTETIAPFSLLNAGLDTSKLLGELCDLCDPPVDRLRVEDAYPCTPLQEGIISLSLKRSGDYVAQFAMEIAGDTDAELFQMAWTEVVNRTPVLRTRILHHWLVGFLQVICEDTIQWTTSNDLDEHIRSDKSATMSLGSPLVRFALIEGSQRYFVLSIHHAIYDAVSLHLLTNMADQMYQGAWDLPPTQPFPHFVKRMLSLNGPSAHTFWRQYLRKNNVDIFPSLPATITQPSADSRTQIAVNLGGSFLDKKSNGITMSTIIRTALGMAISCFSNSQDVVFGLTLSGRTIDVDGVSEMAGPTIATVPFRMQIDLRSDMPVLQLLANTQNSSADLMPHQFLGLQNIARLGKDEDMACQFQTLLVIQTGAPKDAGESNLAGKWLNTSSQTGFSTYAVTLECYVQDATVCIKSQYDSRVIGGWYMDRFLAHLGHLIQQLTRSCNEPEFRLSETTQNHGADQSLLQQWLTRPLRPMVDRCIHEMITQQAQRHPDRLAVDGWDGRLNYLELETLSDCFGQLLIDKGVKPAHVVPLCFNKSVWTIVAMLSVLKAGGAFLLLDPDHPLDRLRALCERCNSRIAVAAPCNAEQARNLVQDVVIFDKAAVGTGLLMKGSRNSSAKPTDIAYIIFTSGSTGLPKGCLVEHRSYCSASINHGATMGVMDDTRTLQYGAYGFAVAIMEILLTLINGACVCVPSDEERRTDPGEAIRRYNASWAYLTSTVLAQLRPEEVPYLQTVVIGGEAIRYAQITQWSGKVHLRQAYGSAETSAVVSSTRICIESDITDVGKPTTGKFWLVDPDDIDCLAIVGAPGEIIIESPTIARGYLGDQAKTSSSFVTPPRWRSQFGLVSAGSRFYRTGDLGVYTSDGGLRLRGRRDTQVKVRGQRLELGEIEHCASSVSQDIRECAVELATPSPNKTGNKDLIIACFLTLRDSHDSGGTLEIGEGLQVVMGDKAVALKELVRAKLKDQLPRYMVPALITVVTDLPKTASKKIDRKVLRQILRLDSEQTLSKALHGNAGNKRVPTTMTESNLRSLWSHALDVDAQLISVDDDFFDIGGHSVSAVKLAFEARKQGLGLAVADIFRHSTIAKQATAVNQSPSQSNVPRFSLLPVSGDELQSTIQTVAAACSVRPSAIEDAYPCTALQEGLISLTQRRSGDYMLQHVLELNDSIPLDRFRAAWEAAYAALPILRTRIVQQTAVRLLQVVVRENLDWHQEYTADLADYLDHDKETPMELGEPLCRLALLKSRGDAIDDAHAVKWFVLTLHHSIYDSVTLDLILATVKASYFDTPRPSHQDFSHFIKHLGDVDGQAANDFWRALLADSQPTCFPSVSSTTSALVTSQYESLERPCRLPPSHSKIADSTIVRAAVAVLIEQHTRNADVLFGEVLSGRNVSVPGIAEVVGPTIATVPVQVRLRTDAVVSDLLTDVQRQVIDRMPFEQIGLRNIKRFNQQVPEFQTLLVLEPAKDRDQSTYAFGIWLTDSEQSGFETYALTLTCILPRTGSNDFHFKARFDANVISNWLVGQYLDQLSDIVHQLRASESQAPISSIELVTEAARETLWNTNAQVPERLSTTVTQLFAERAIAQPQSIAVESWDGSFTYTELDTLSDRLARHICRTHKALTGHLVPLVFEKSAQTVLAIIAVMKAGGASVTLDVTQPFERLRSTVNQLDASIVLCSTINEHLAQQLLPGRRAIIVSKESAKAMDAVGGSLPEVSPSDNVCVVFTSGSTGRPKGVALAHAGFATAIKHQAHLFGHGSDARVFSFAAYSFDISWFDTLHALATGSCIVVPSESERKNDLENALAQSGATVAFLTPTVARLLNPDRLPHLRCLALGGEPQRWSDFAGWPMHVGKVSVYGPAECTVVSSAEDASILKRRDQTLPKGIGLNMWLIDPNNVEKLCAPGTEGEIVLEGHLVGSGYINSAEQNAASFVHDPAWLVKGSRTHPGRPGCLYRTGDLARYTADGRMEFTGRNDGQRKIRGQRIELAEVELHVQQGLTEPSQVIAEMVPLAGEDATPVLVAFVQPLLRNNSTGSRFAAEDYTPFTKKLSLMQAPTGLITSMTRSLPSYMVPQIFFAVREMPLTSNGKTDRKRLRALASSTSRQDLARFLESTVAKCQPQTPRALQLQDAWAQVLQMETSIIGTEDNFFQLGGDSVAAMRLVGYTRKQGIASITVTDIFDHPTIASLARLDKSRDNTTDLSSAARPASYSLLGSEIDVQALQSRLTATNSLHQPMEDAYPCTPMQQGLLSLTSKQTGDYLMQNLLELPDDPNFPFQMLLEAWEETFRTFPILRTRIVEDGELGLLQVQLQDEHLHWHRQTVDSLEQFLAADKLSPIVPSHLLARFNILTEPGVSSPRWLVITLHHAIYDAWSLQTIMHAARDIFQSKVGSSMFHPSVAGVWTDFRRFVKYVQQQDTPACAYYWRKELEGFASGPFPAKKSNSFHRPSMQVATCEFPAPNSGSYTASVLARAALAVLISRNTQASEATFGAIVSGRSGSLSGINTIAGPTVATVPLRIHVDSSSNIHSFLTAIQQQFVEMVQYEQAGLQNIAKLSEDCNNACAFHTLLVVQPEEKPQDTTSSLDHHDVDAWYTPGDQLGFATYPLTIQCTPKAEVVNFEAHFDATVLNTWQVEMLLGQLSDIYQHLAQSPYESPLLDIPRLPAADKELIWQWNRSVPPTTQRCLHDFLDEQARDQPDAQAIQAWDGEMSYSELYRLSSALAISLADVGVRPGTIVPLLFEKSTWTVVTVFAVLKTGAAFNLLDVTLPEGRLETIVRESMATVICCSTLQEGFARRMVADVIVVGSTSRQTLGNILLQSLPAVDPMMPAYLVFTSGSTGTPKGALVPHASFASAIEQQRAPLNLSRNSRVYDFASYSFDVAVHNIVSTIAAGGCVCVASDADRKSRLEESINELGANYMSLTASVADLIEPTQVPSVQTLVFLGEPVRQTSAERWWHTNVRLITSYGPAECTPTSTVNASAASPEQLANIGQGCGAVAWVADSEDHGSLVPLGEVGELLLEGPVLGAGYLHDGEKTAAAFIEDPGWLLEGPQGCEGRKGRLYKTGDLVHYNANGGLQIVGRKDTQVKVRGQRVELGEVEACLRSSMDDSNHNVVVEAFEARDTGATTLAAFILSAPHDHTNEEFNTGSPLVESSVNDRQKALLASLSKKLSRRLASYMVPTLYVPVTRIPLTPTGKIDRRKLKLLGSALSVEDLRRLRRLSSTATCLRTPPSSQLERQIAQIWASLLRIQTELVGRHDDFFMLGGDSISAMRFVAESRRQGWQCSVADLFEQSTIAELAKLLAEREPEAGIGGAEDIRYDPFALVPPEVRKAATAALRDAPWHKDDEVEDVLPTTDFQALFLQHGLDMPQSAFNYFYMNLGRDVDRSKLWTACWRLVDRFAILRTAFVQVQHSLWQAVLRLRASTLFEEIAAPARVDLDDACGTLCRQDVADAGGLKLSQVPTKFILQSSETQGCQLIVRLSHAQYDGISLPIMLEMLAALYTGRPVETMGESFTTYLAHQRSRSRHAPLSSSERSPSARALSFPLKFVHGDEMASPPHRVEARTSVLLTPNHDRSYIASLLGAAWAIVQAVLNGEADAVTSFGHLVAGRESSKVPGIDRIAGPCAKILTVNVRVTPNQTSWETLLSEVRRCQWENSITEEAASVRHSVVVQHQNVEENPVLDFGGGVRSQVQWHDHSHRLPASPLAVVSRLKGEKLDIQVLGSSRHVTASAAQQLVDSLRKAADAMLAGLAGGGMAVVSNVLIEQLRADLKSSSGQE